MNDDFANKLGDFPVGKYEISGLSIGCLCPSLQDRERPPSMRRAYSAYISRQTNLPIAPIIKLLGEPSQRFKGAYIYEAEGIQLYMEENQDGDLVGIKLK